MPDQSWAEGYVVDIGYTHGFYRELAPSLLRFAAMLGGVNTVDIAQPYTYVELGCGNGDSTNLFAAANPHGQFFGVDFNPTHIHSARQRAEKCGIHNVTFLERSFAELGETELPDADVIVLHGVYSWVNAENRQHIVELIRQRLKPAGIVYVSYNALPGLSQVTPLQRLFVDFAATTSGSTRDRVRESLKFAKKLEAAGARYFSDNPVAAARLTKLSEQDPRYLAHEYFNASWVPFFHADVASEMAQAKLSYVGSGTLIENFDQLVLAPEVQKIVAGFGDRVMAETVKDFARNQIFRRDVFTRGAAPASPPERERQLGETRFSLAVPRDQCRFTLTTAAGEVAMTEEVYAPLLDALANGPRTFDELTRAPELSRRERGQVRQALFGMAALGNVLPALPTDGDEARRTPTSQFNEAALAEAILSGSYATLASPVLGNGVSVSFVDALLLQNQMSGGEEPVVHVQRGMQRAGAKLVLHGKPVEAEEQNRALIEGHVDRFSRDLMPFLTQLGIAK